MPFPKGTNNEQTILTPAEVLAIYTSELRPLSVLAARYNVGKTTVHHILSGRTWRWLTGATKKPRKSAKSVRIFARNYGPPTNTDEDRT